MNVTYLIIVSIIVLIPNSTVIILKIVITKPPQTLPMLVKQLILQTKIIFFSQYFDNYTRHTYLDYYSTFDVRAKEFVDILDCLNFRLSFSDSSVSESHP